MYPIRSKLSNGFRSVRPSHLAVDRVRLEIGASTLLGRPGPL